MVRRSCGGCDRSTRVEEANACVLALGASDQDSPGSRFIYVLYGFVEGFDVGQLKMAYTIDMPTGSTETIPLVHDGVMYATMPSGAVRALDAATGTTIWEYKRPGGGGRSKTLAIYQDLILYAAPDSYVVGIDARTGEMRWQSKVETRGNSSGPLVADGKVISGGSCSGNRNNCFISAHDAMTGKELWSVSPGFDVSGHAISYKGANGKQYVVIPGPKMIAYALPQ